MRVGLRVLADGRLALPMYTSATTFVEGCGEYQPGCIVDDAGLQTIIDTSACDVVLIDGGRRSSGGRDSAFDA